MSNAYSKHCMKPKVFFYHLVFALKASLLLLLCVSCSDDEMSLAEKETALLGKWQESVDERFPERIASIMEFLENKEYKAQYFINSEEFFHEGNYYIDADSLHIGFGSYKYKFSHTDTLLLECVNCGPNYVYGQKYVYKYSRIK